MSFVTNLMFLNMATMTRSNATYSSMQANQSKMNLVGGLNCEDGDKLDLSSLHKADKKLTFTSLKNQLQAKMAAVMENSIKKQIDKDIKEQFSTFA